MFEHRRMEETGLVSTSLGYREGGSSCSPSVVIVLTRNLADEEISFARVVLCCALLQPLWFWFGGCIATAVVADRWFLSMTCSACLPTLKKGLLASTCTDGRWPLVRTYFAFETRRHAFVLSRWRPLSLHCPPAVPCGCGSFTPVSGS